MLIRTTSKFISGRVDSDLIIADKTNGDVILVNAKYVNGIKTRASTKSSFMFTEAEKGAPHYIESEDTVANLKIRADLTWNSLFVDVPLYPDNNTALSTVTTSINCDSILYVIKDQTAKATRSYIFYKEGSRKRKVLCAYSINQIYAISDTGKLTTS